jgi:hypothetical protein
MLSEEEAGNEGIVPVSRLPFNKRKLSVLSEARAGMAPVRLFDDRSLFVNSSATSTKRKAHVVRSVRMFEAKNLNRKTYRF